MDEKGRALDTVRTERLWRTVKYAHVYVHDYRSPREAHQQLGQFLHIYNQRRFHEALDYRMPAEAYTQATRAKI
jgi:putative transposase